jgi:hypothetical protein
MHLLLDGVGVDLLVDNEGALGVRLHEGGVALAAEVLQVEQGGHLLAQLDQGNGLAGCSLLVVQGSLVGRPDPAGNPPLSVRFHRWWLCTSDSDLFRTELNEPKADISCD